MPKPDAARAVIAAAYPLVVARGSTGGATLSPSESNVYREDSNSFYCCRERGTTADNRCLSAVTTTANGCSASLFDFVEPQVPQCPTHPPPIVGPTLAEVPFTRLSFIARRLTVAA